MKKIIFTLIWIFAANSAHAWNAWILWWSKGNEISAERIRSWDIHTDDIPNIISWAIDFLMWIAWTITIIFIIVGAFKMTLWSMTNKSQEWKKTIFLAIWGFVVASLAWVIVKLVIDNFS